jgi:hypothetical protein
MCLLTASQALATLIIKTITRKGHKMPETTRRRPGRPRRVEPQVEEVANEVECDCQQDCPDCEASNNVIEIVIAGTGFKATADDWNEARAIVASTATMFNLDIAAFEVTKRGQEYQPKVVFSKVD